MRADEYPDVIKKLTGYLEGNFAGYLEILENMVSINSYTDNSSGVNALGDYTARLFEGLGFSSEQVPHENSACGNHLLCHRTGNSAGSIALISHLDTVYAPEEEKERNFSFRVRGDRAYGPGTCDIKGGTLIIYMMFHALRELLPEFFSSVSWQIFF